VIGREYGGGFQGIGEKVHGGWLYHCDGMPSMLGCGRTTIVPRRFNRVGRKKTGWLVCYGLEPNTPHSRFDSPEEWHEDHDIVLTFCPECAEVVLGADN
jgi:hypothetical protein